MSVLRNEKTRRVALMGLLFALSVVLSFLEGTLTPLLGLPPGVKLGLANVVVMYALFFLGRGSAFTLVLLKSFFVLLTLRCDGRRAEPRRRFVVAWRNGCPVPFQEQAFGIHTLRVRRDHT